AVGAADGDILDPAGDAFADDVMGVHETDIDLVVADDQARRRLRTVRRAAAVIEKLKAGDAIFVRNKIIDHANHEFLLGFTIWEAERAIGGDVILPGEGGNIREAEASAYDARRAAAAANGDHRIGAVFIDIVFGLREFKAARAGDGAA